MISSKDPAVARHASTDVEARPSPRLRPALYSELRALARRMFRRERCGHALEPTALVHEAWLKLAGQERVDWEGSSQVLALGAQAMRRVLVDHARALRREKRGAGRTPVALTDDVVVAARDATPDLVDVDVDAVLSRLERRHPRQARVVELRFFTGLAVREVARELGVSVRTVEADWTAAKAWLRRELAGELRG